MRIKKFEEIKAWQKAEELVVMIYQELRQSKDYGFKDQIQRAGISIMNNIAEGFERKSNKEFKYFLFMAKGSCAEVRSMLYLAIKLNYLSEAKFKQLSTLSVEISRMLSGFIKTL